MDSVLKNLSHHAYCLVGGQSLVSELKSVLEKKHKISAQANPDFFDRAYNNFTIDDARDIKSLAGTRPIGESAKKIFILQMNGITVEAQNALLKLLEEPSDYAHFFLIIPSTHLLLPTIKSRISFIETSADESGENDEVLAEARKFIKLSPAKRIDYLKGLLDDISKEKKVKQDAIVFLNAVESVVYKERGAKSGLQALQSIEVARKYMSDRAPSLKMLLEYVALNV